MSSEAPKKITPKPFLKKGTRQFLSNAQVRSQADKPKVMEYGIDQQEVPQQFVQKKIHKNEQDFEIPIKSNTVKKTEIQKKQKPPLVRNRQPLKSKQKIKNQQKETLLEDYLDTEAPYSGKGGSRTSIQKSSSKRDTSQSKFQNNRKNFNQPPTRAGSLTQMLQRQDDDYDDSIDMKETTKGGKMQNDSFKPIQNPIKKQKKQINLTEEDDEEKPEEYNFNSDSQDEEPQIPIRKKDKLLEKYLQSKEKEENPSQKKHGSKVLKKYFGKQQAYSEQPVKANPKKLTVQDIPKQLKQQIINEAIAEQQEALNREINKLKEKIVSANKSKEKFEEDLKLLNREKQQFEKQMQEKNREFEEKIKNQNKKLTIEKKYMKDVQLSGKPDIRLKNQVNEVRKMFEDEKKQKKKIQTRLRAEITRLKEKLSQETQNNKLLTEQIKMLEYGNLMNKEKLKEVREQAKQQKNMNKIQKGDWENAPQNSYLFSMFENNFSLNMLDFEQYDEEANEFYQYYLKVQHQPSELISEQYESDRVKRIYRNGKIEHEFFNKYIKQIFPFGYVVVHFQTGDIKQTINQKMTIYYSSKANITQYTISEKKNIYFFKDNQTVEMKQEVAVGKEIHEVYNGQHLKKTLPSGQTIFEKKK